MYFISSSGYAPPFWGSVGILFLCLIYINSFLPESLKEKQNFNKFSIVANAKRIKEFTLAKRGPYINVCLVLSLFAFVFALLDYFGSAVVLYSKHEPLCWGPDMIGYYMTAKAGVASIGIVFTFKVINKCVPETLIVILGCVAFMVSNVMLGFAKTTLVMFLTCVPAFFMGVAPSAIRSYVSKLVQSHEEGTLCSILGVTEVLARLLAPVIINMLYPVGLNDLDLPGFAFFVEAGLLVIPITLFAIIHYLIQKSLHFPYRSLPEYNGEARIQA